MTRLFARTRVAVVFLLGLTMTAMAIEPAATPLPCPSPFSGPLTVEEAVAFALTHNPRVTLALQDVRVADYQIDSARAAGRPSLDVLLRGTYLPNPQSVNFEGQQIETQKSLSTSGQFSVSIPVWPTDRWKAPIAAALANACVSQEVLERTRESLAFQTRQAFYQFLTANELQRVAADAMLVSQRQLQLAEVTVEAGLAAPLDIFQAQATLAQSELQLVQAQNNVALTRDALATQLGLPAGTPLEVVEPGALPTVPPSPDPLVAEALNTRPEIRELTFRKEQLCANRRVIQLAQRPIVNLDANYTQTLLGGGLFGQDGASISATLAWNLYNGGRTKAEVNAVDMQIAQIDTLLLQANLGITQDVRQAWLNLRTAEQQLPAALQQLEAANESLRISQLRYENGEGILLEVEQAQFQRTQAQNDVAQARFSALVAEAQLLFATSAPVPGSRCLPPKCPPPAPCCPGVTCDPTLPPCPGGVCP